MLSLTAAESGSGKHQPVPVASFDQGEDTVQINPGRKMLGVIMDNHTATVIAAAAAAISID